MFEAIRQLFSFGRMRAGAEPVPDRPPPRVPENCRVFVIGDIHGRVDLLQRLHGMIAGEVAAGPPSLENVVVYLGDYIDRGEQSREVIDLLLEQPLTGCQLVHLKGNHEAELQDFLSNPTGGHAWTVHGGMATALSYRIKVAARISASERMREMRDQLLAGMPRSHQEFLSSLRFRYEVGDYFMVHAGVRPGVALDKQRPVDMLWIREPFLSAERPFERCIVHGHTISAEPVVTPVRIGIDTGAYHSGRLTCLVLEGAERRFLST